MPSFDDSTAFIEALAARKFTRNARSQVLYELEPGDYVAISNKGVLQSLLSELDIQINSDILRADPAAAWHWLISLKWRLPRTGGRPIDRRTVHQ
jgi:hypothetical protein